MLLNRCFLLFLVAPVSDLMAFGYQSATTHSKRSQAKYHEGKAKSFKEGESVDIKVANMESYKTLVSRDYYSLPFCRPSSPNEHPQQDKQNFGQLLIGDVIQSAPLFDLRMKKDVYCQPLCVMDLEDEQISNNVEQAIRDEYRSNWLIDNLPAGFQLEDEAMVVTKYWGGVPLGFIAEFDYEAYIYNHLNIELFYHKDDDTRGTGNYQVVKALIEPFSIPHDFDEEGSNGDGEDKIATITGNPIASCDPNYDDIARPHTTYNMVARARQPAKGKILFTYDVIWTEDPTTDWDSRWNVYLTMNGAVPRTVHWNSITHSFFALVWSLIAVTLVLVRSLRQNRESYKFAAEDEENPTRRARTRRRQTATSTDNCADHCDCCSILACLLCGVNGLVCVQLFGCSSNDRDWRNLHGDVFRPPRLWPVAFAVCCGIGAQLFGTVLVMLSMMAATGYPTFVNRGHLAMVSMVVFALMASVGGYTTAWFLRAFGTSMTQYKPYLFAAWTFPAVLFFLSGFLRTFVVPSQTGSSTGQLVLILLPVLVFWFAVMLLLTFLGAWVAGRGRESAAEIGIAEQTSSDPRDIPRQPCYIHMIWTLFLSAVFLFGSILVEQLYVMESFWSGYFYDTYGVLVIVTVIIVATCASMTVLVTYLKLCHEDYRWWWSSFLHGGIAGAAVFFYAFFFKQSLAMNSLATSLYYYGFMALSSAVVFFVLGFVGTVSSLWFNRIMYASSISTSEVAEEVVELMPTKGSET